MYEYYNYENSKAQQEELARKAAAQKKAEKSAKRKKWWGIVLGALVFGVIASGTFVTVTTIGSKAVDLKGRIEKIEEKHANKNANDSADTEEQDAKADVSEAEGKNKKADAGESSSGVKINRAESAKAAPMEQEDQVVASVSDVAKVAMPSIVAITNKSLQEIHMMFSYETQFYESESQGSGIIVGQNDEELLILTNNHVVDGAKSLSVCFIDDEAAEAEVVGTNSSNDVAVIAVKLENIKASTQDQIKIALVGNSDDLEIGEQVVAIGNALGYGQSVTTGIVSAVNRNIGMSNLAAGLIQTDAAINPGNSGGALLNMKGEVIGINSAKLSDTQVEGMCYALPINTALPIAEQLMNRADKEVVAEDEAGYMGIVGVLISKSDSEKYSMPEGIYLQQIVKDSPAERAGLRVGDIIEKFENVKIGSYAELQDEMKYYAAGDDVTITIYRQDGGEYVEKTIRLTLGKRMD